ncbi:transposase family protein [Diaphorobacter sp. NR2-3-3-1]|nr:transposase family protein [Diaphorobacter caeni]
MALWRRRPTRAVIVHSDQGSQFTSHDWQDFLDDHNLLSNMSHRGNCHDNTVAESFFRLLRRERIRRQIYPTRDEARAMPSTTSRCSTTQRGVTAPPEMCLR